MLGALSLQHLGGERQFVFGRLLGQDRIFQHPHLILGANFVGSRRAAPLGLDMGAIQQDLGFATARIGHQQDRGPLLARPARAARTVQQTRLVHRQISMDHQAQFRQVQPPRSHIGGDADPGMAIAQSLQRIAALPLAQLTRQAHH